MILKDEVENTYHFQKRCELSCEENEGKGLQRLPVR